MNGECVIGNVQKTPIDQCVLITQHRFEDHRGTFQETYSCSEFYDHVLPNIWMQDNISWTRPGVIRGLHIQMNRPQGKLIACLVGEIWDVCVDARLWSDTYGQWVAMPLSGKDEKFFYVPAGCLHGFAVLGDEKACVQYKCTTLFDRDSDGGVRYNDPNLNIPWPISKPILSQKDLGLAMLNDYIKQVQ